MTSFVTKICNTYAIKMFFLSVFLITFTSCNKANKDFAKTLTDQSNLKIKEEKTLMKDEEFPLEVWLVE